MVKAVGRGLLLSWVVFACLLLLLRYVLMPVVGQFRAEIVDHASRALRLQLEVQAIEGQWSGWRPRLVLQEVAVFDDSGALALQLPQVDATLSWSSLVRGLPYFHRLEILRPQLNMQRDATGKVFIAGLPLTADGSDHDSALDWLLAQRQIVIRDARLRWQDHWLASPELELEEVEFKLVHGFASRRFGLRARPPQELASLLDVRGELFHLDPARLSDTVLRLYVELERSDLQRWQDWFEQKWPLEGSGGVRAWLELNPDRQLAHRAGLGRGHSGLPLQWRLSADLALEAVRSRLGRDLPEFEFGHLRGQVELQRLGDELRISTAGLTVSGAQGLALNATELELALRSGPSLQEGGMLRVNELDFSQLARLAHHLPLDETVRTQLAQFAPQGRLRDLRLSWQGELSALHRWTLATRFDELGLQAHQHWPGLGGLSGWLEGNESGGRYRIQSSAAHLDLPRIFDAGQLVFDELQAEGGWQQRGGRLQISFDGVHFSNADAAGSAQGSYWPHADHAGEIDLQARLTRADGGAVWRYLPRVVGSTTQHWVRDAIRHAAVAEASLRLRGELTHFPFRDGEGDFRVLVRVADAELDYAEGWPVIEDIFAELNFNGPGLRIEASRGQILGVALNGVVVDIPELDAHLSDRMEIRGKARGRTADFLRFVAASPVSARIGGFTEHIQADGSGELDLTLVMPLLEPEASTVKGEFRFGGNQLRLAEDLPPLEKAAGRLRFSEHSLEIPQASASFLGGTTSVSAHTDAHGVVEFNASGQVHMTALLAQWELPLLGHLAGEAPWQAQIRLDDGMLKVNARSDLEGVVSSLPAPFNKGRSERWPLRADFRTGGGTQSPALELELEADDHRLRAALAWPPAQEVRGKLQIGPLAEAMEWPALSASEQGIDASVKLAMLDGDLWRELVADPDVSTDGLSLPWGDLRVDIGQLSILGQQLQDFRWRSERTEGGWQARLDSDRAAGELQWRERGAGALRARFEHLSLGEIRAAGNGVEAPSNAETATDEQSAPQRLPALDVVAERFVLHGRELGSLELQARNRGGSWQLEQLMVDNEDARFSGSGQWRHRGISRTALNFKLEVKDIGRFSRRLGYEDVVRGGKAQLSGDLRWRGAPTQIDYPSLGGQLQVQAERGQFNKLEPGVGRLLGILSLQALPRRITLDFRDVFSAGFAFDTISGSIDLAQGVMHTGNLGIRGPAARIVMRGWADLKAETQDLRVVVQPTLSESIAIGAAAGLVNPVAGVVTYLAQKALSDPIEKLFAYEYEIRGSWSDPVVQRLGRLAEPIQE